MNHIQGAELLVVQLKTNHTTALMDMITTVRWEVCVCCGFHDKDGAQGETFKLDRVVKHSRFVFSALLS